MKRLIIITAFYCMIKFLPLSAMVLEDQDVLNIYTTLRVIKKIQRDVESNEIYEFKEENDQINQVNNDCIKEVIIILITMYEKIVTATVTYYLVSHQTDLHTIITQIIAEDTIKIIHVLGKKIIYFISNEEMTLQEKLKYCGGIISLIVLFKLGIDQLPKDEKLNDKKEDSLIEKNQSFLQNEH